MAFPTGWLCRAALVIDHTKVPADQTAFPVLITEACFATNCPEILTTGDTHAAQSDGGDLRFSTDSAGASQVACEVVVWSQNATFASAKAEIHVPRNILTASDVTLYVWWSAGGGLSQPARSAAFGSESVWSGNYEAVYHLNQATNAQAVDSTGNLYHSTVNVSTQIVGKIGNGQSFTAASSEYLALPAPFPFNPFSISAWVNVASGARAAIYEGRNGSGVGDLIFSDPTTSNHIIAYNNNGAGEVFQTTAVGTDGTWHYVVLTYNAGTAKLYVDNNAAVTYPGSWSSQGGGNTSARIGRESTGTFRTQSQDETRLLVTQLSADWITTEYNNQSSPGTFIISGVRADITGGSPGPAPQYTRRRLSGGTLPHSGGLI